MKHQLYDLLLDLNLSTAESFEFFHQGVRDDESIKVYRCKQSGVIILDDISGSNEEVYKEKKGMEYFKTIAINEDDRKRAEAYKDLIKGKNWLDFGCGQGGPSLLMKDIAHTAHGLELQEAPREYLNSQGVKCFASLDDLENNYYDVITMFHVFEHLSHPVDLLKNCREKLKPGGILIVEVPHADDALLSVYENESFKKFTLWSEHLILHTAESLKRFIEKAAFEVESVKYLQRYPLANHLYWLAKNKPGGHEVWSFLNSPKLEEAYTETLANLGKTDSIVAFCRK